MSIIQYTGHSDIVLGFKRIPRDNYSRQIFFVEKHLDQIRNMDDYERIDILDNYNRALFEIGHYRKCVDTVEPLIYDVLNEHFTRKEEDVFCSLLQRKSFALYNLGEFANAQHVSSELLKINPSIQETRLVITHSIYKQIKEKTKRLRAFAMLMLLLGVTVTCFDLLIVENFYPEQTSRVSWVQLFTIAGALGLLFGIEVYAYFKGKRNADKTYHTSIKKQRANL